MGEKDYLVFFHRGERQESPCEYTMPGLTRTVAIVDRWASHENNPVADLWNKMSLPIFEQPLRPHFFAPARQRLLDHLGVRLPSTRKAPKLVYIDRQNTGRKLSDEIHSGVLRMLDQMSADGLVDAHYVVLEDLSPQEQVRAIAGAKVGPAWPRICPCQVADSLDHARNSWEWLDPCDVDRRRRNAHRGESAP